MAEELTRRVNSKIGRLPEDIRNEVDARIQDNKISLRDTSEWLKEQGYDISQSAVKRHAVHVRKAAQRVANMLEKSKLIVQMVERNPDTDYTKASRIIAMDGLLQKVSTAEEEFLEMPLEKAVRLIASLSRTEIYDQKAKFDNKSKMELAFDNMAIELSEKIKADPQLKKEFNEVMSKARERLFGDE